MRVIGGWRRIAVAVLSTAVLFGATLTLAGSADPSPAAPRPEPVQAKPPVISQVVDVSVLDAGAPPEVKKRIEAVRARLGNNPRFQVGYSKAAGRTLKQLAGTVKPADLVARVQKQRIASAQHQSKNPTVDARRHELQANPNAPTPSLTAFDWSQFGVVGSVKDQGLCGDCWCFATVGVFESMYAIRNGTVNMLQLYEEQLLRCNTENPPATCCGGWWGFDYITATGLVGDDRIPYQSGNISCDSGVQVPGLGPCPDISGFRKYQAATWSYVDGVDGATNIPDPSLIKKALCDHGPVICGVNVTEAFQLYKSGVFVENDPGDINHAVMIVGWTPEGWIVRNSWGADWGQNGYILIDWNTNKIGFGAAWVEPVVFGQ